MTPVLASAAPTLVLADMHVGMWTFVFGVAVLSVAAIQAFLLRRLNRHAGPRVFTAAAHWLFLLIGVCWFIAGGAMLLVADSPEAMWLPMMLAGLLLVGVMTWWLPQLRHQRHA
jgi:hypothetical protein